MIGYGTSGTAHSFYAYSASGQVWNGAAFEAWNAANYLTYRITATELASSGRFTGTTPTGTLSYELRVNGASLALSVPVWESDPQATDYARIENPAATQGLSGTTIKDATDVETALALKPTAAQIATALLTDLLSGTDFNTSGSFGKLIKDYLDAAVSSRLASAGYTAPPSAASNAGAVWNEARAGHVTAGTFGEGVIVKTLPSPAPSGYGAIGAVTIDEQDVVIGN